MSQSVEPSKDDLRREAVTENQIAQLFALIESGASVPAAAASVGIHRRTAYRALERYQDSLAGVQKLLAMKAFKAVDDWVKASEVAAEKGDHRPAKDWLQTIRAVDPVGDAGAHGVTIVIGTPDAPIRIPAQTVDLSPTSYELEKRKP